jgi:hypothetical protein
LSTHRREVRPRYGRIAVLATSLTISAVAALAGLGVLASGSATAGAAAKPASYTQSTPTGQEPQQDPSSSATSGGTPLGADAASAGSQPAAASPTAVPADSGSGRRIVFSQSLQRVWLLGQRPDDVQRTYLVSGSVTHNLQPGTYAVYSKARWAVGVEDSGVMQYFVRFTRGPTGAAIGFHSIPSKNGVPLQTRAQLGTAQSHGCIRQNMPDAIALWNFAPIGTTVVVVA